MDFEGGKVHIAKCIAVFQNLVTRVSARMKPPLGRDSSGNSHKRLLAKNEATAWNLRIPSTMIMG